MTRPRHLKTAANPPEIPDSSTPPGLAAHLAGWRRLEDVEPENSSEIFQVLREVPA